MRIPTTLAYQDLYLEFQVHCEMYNNERMPLAKVVIDKINIFAEEYKEFLSACFEGVCINRYEWLILIQTMPYHSTDIRRIAEEIYIDCEDGLKSKHFHENPYRDRIRASREFEDLWNM